MMLCRGELRWGVRKSFVDYVEALPDGNIETVAPADRRSDEAGFRLPGRQIAENTWEFAGGMRFFGYAGVLDVAFTGFRIETNSGAGSLSGEIGDVRVTLAEFDEVNVSDECLIAEAVRFTADGAAALGGVYPPGTPADPLTICWR